jgi:hypothetical protein
MAANEKKLRGENTIYLGQEKEEWSCGKPQADFAILAGRGRISSSRSAS